MATQINLLPWRETHRKETNQRFGMALAGFVAVAALIGGAGFKWAEGNVKHQEKRNQRLEHEIALLQEELKEIEELEDTKNKLLARMEIIQQLQAKRPQIVHTFHEIASRIPDGVYLTKASQEGEDRMTVHGKAESNARVSALMRTLDRSDYFTDPKLYVIQVDSEDESISEFSLLLSQIAPKPEELNDEQ